MRATLGALSRSIERADAAVDHAPTRRFAQSATRRCALPSTRGFALSPNPLIRALDNVPLRAAVDVLIRVIEDGARSQSLVLDARTSEHWSRAQRQAIASAIRSWKEADYREVISPARRRSISISMGTFASRRAFGERRVATGRLRDPSIRS
jgi:hypothetical protein